MCDRGYTAQLAAQSAVDEPASEIALAKMLKDDLSVSVEPQALRMFIRYRWNRVQTLAHRIYDGKR